MTEITNTEAIYEWSNAPQESLETFGDEGDFVRQHLLNPALFELLGDVAGKRILDAGCGQGYLSRLLARRRAIVTGVEPAANFYRYAIERERSEQLGISYIQEDLSTLSLASNIFDAVIANMVFMDIPDYETAMILKSTTVVLSCHVRYNLPITRSNHNDCGLFHCWIERNRTTSCV
jgi:2-polyprenyl-3-methyl-5-hydroxy-6-metoxy-1,4-benzoquinol methylase